MESSTNVPRADPTDAVEVESYVSGSEAEILERSRRSTSSLVPCHLLEEEGSLVRVGYTSAIADLVRRTEGVRNTSESIKQYIRSTYLASNILTILGENQAVIPTADLRLTDAKITAATQQPNQALKEHYSLLFQLVTHVEYIRTHDQIGHQTAYASLHKKLDDLEAEIYGILCDIKIALISKHVDTSPIQTTFQVSPAFVNAGIGTTNETLRAYVVIKDCEIVMTFLRGIYYAMSQAPNVSSTLN